MRRIYAPTVIAAFALFLAAPAAEAAPVTVGAPLSGTFTSGSCSGSCTILGTGASPSYTSPVDGVIVRWRILGGEAMRSYKLRVFTPGAAGAFTAAGSSAPGIAIGEGIETFPASVPVKAGQTIGIDLEPTASLDHNMSTGSYTFIEPHPADGETQTPGAPVTGEWAYNADVQPAPRITAITPAGGSTAGGTQVSITGTDLEGAASVRFGSTPASFTQISENLVTAIAPAGSGAVPISVTTIAGTATSPQPFTFTAPTIPPPAPATPVVPVATCKVPQVKGKSLKAAKRRIHAADCTVGKATKRRGASAKTGKVVSQVPAPGTTLPVGTKVKLTLAPRSG